MATTWKGEFHELIRRNKSGDRSGDELRRVDGRRYGARIANVVV